MRPQGSREHADASSAAESYPAMGTPGSGFSLSMITAARGDLTIVLPKVMNWHEVGASGDKLFGVLTCVHEDGKAFEQRFGSAEG